MAFYECVFIARQDISGTQAEGLIETFATLVGENGGQVTKKEYWGLKNLAYRIKKNRKGHYALMNLDAPSAAVNELERNMKINEDVLRFLTVRVDALEEGPSAALQSRGARDERPRRSFGDRGGFGGDRGGFGGDRGGFGGDRGGERAERAPVGGVE
jgi:small subunit ribosomal protein S6